MLLSSDSFLLMITNFLEIPFLWVYYLLSAAHQGSAANWWIAFWVSDPSENNAINLAQEFAYEVRSCSDSVALGTAIGAQSPDLKTVIFTDEWSPIALESHKQSFTSPLMSWSFAWTTAFTKTEAILKDISINYMNVYMICCSITAPLHRLSLSLICVTYVMKWFCTLIPLDFLDPTIIWLLFLPSPSWQSPVLAHFSTWPSNFHVACVTSTDSWW